MAVQATSSAADDRSGLDAVVRIVARVGGGQEVFLGTGTVVARRHVVTCRHVVVEHDPFGQTLGALRQDLGVGLASGECLAVEATRVEPSLDLAILTMAEAVDVDEPVFVTRITRDTEPRLRAQSFAAYGYRQAHDAPELWDHELSHLALLSSYRRGNDTMAQLQLSGGLPAGTSGGPVLLNREGTFYFLGTVYLGGERSATSRLIMADDVLLFVTETGVAAVRTIDAADLFCRIVPARNRRAAMRTALAVLGLVTVASIATAAIDWTPSILNEVARVEDDMTVEPALPLPQMPSIAVLPFEGLGEKKALRDLSVGTTDSLSAALSKVSELFVISNDAVMLAASKKEAPAHIANGLGVQYALKGSVQQSGERLRISAQLLDMTAGASIWAGTHDGPLDEIFELQDRLIQDIVAALDLELSPAAKAAISRPETTSTTAYRFFVRGMDLLRRNVVGALALAVDSFEAAIELDPGYGRAHAGLVEAYWASADNGRYRNLGLNSAADARIEAGIRLGDALQHPTALAFRVASEMHLMHRRYTKALATAERALALDPNDPDAHIALARTLIFAGRPEQALPHIERAMRLNPRISVTISDAAVQATTSAPAGYLVTLGLARFGTERFRAAASLFERAITQDPNAITAAVPLAAAYGHLGELDHARAALDRLIDNRSAVIGRRPTLAEEQRAWPFKNVIDLTRLVDGLRIAGLT